MAVAESTRVIKRDLGFAVESLESFWDDAFPIMQANHLEVGGLTGRTFNPNREAFKRIEAAGALRIFTARLAGALIGYAVFMIAPSLNYSDSLIAITHVVYVKPEHRGRRAIRFIRWQDDCLLKEGVTDIMRQSPARLPNHRTYERMGYRNVETVYVKGA